MTTEKILPIQVRTLDRSTPGELPLIYSSWLETFRDGNHPRPVQKHLYYDRQHLVIERILARPTTTVLMVCPEDDPSTIVGWLCWEITLDGWVVHYMFVKAAFREMGVGSSLLRVAGIDPDRAIFSHWTDDWKRSMLSGHPGMLYDPYRAYMDIYQREE